MKNAIVGLIGLCVSTVGAETLVDLNGTWAFCG